jgi:hypothetical protein
MGDGIGAGFASDFDQALGNERAGNGGAQQIVAFVAGVGAHHGEHEIAHEFFAQVIDIDVLGLHAHQFGLGARGGQLFALPKVGRKGYDFAIIGDLQPLEDDAGVETAGIGENDALDVGHGGALRKKEFAGRLAGRRRGSKASRARPSAENPS